MKKNILFDTKAFMLIETLLVSLTVSGILLYMYVQFSAINRSYQGLYHYNNVSSIYRLGALKDFLIVYGNEEKLYESLLNNSEVLLLDCGEMSSNSIIENSVISRKYCEKVFEKVNASYVYLIIDDNEDFDRTLKLMSDELYTVNIFERTLVESKLIDFFKMTKIGDTKKYRLVALFHEGTIPDFTNEVCKAKDCNMSDDAMASILFQF